MKSYLIPALTLGILAASVGQAQAVTISFDDFNTPFGSSPGLSGDPNTALLDTLVYSGGVVTGGTAAPTTGSVGYSLGGNSITRNSQVDVYGNSATNATRRGFLQGQDLDGTQTVRFDNASSSRSTARIVYDFGASGIDLVSGTNNGLRLSYLNNTGALFLGVTVTDANNNTFSLGSAADGNGVQGPSPITLQNSVDTFVNQDLKFSLFTGVDFSQIKSVQFDLNQSVADGDANFAFIGATAVPEPLTILGTLLAGGVGVAMKKKKQQLEKETI